METAQQYRNRYETWMRENNLLPDNAVFSVQNNTLRWDVASKQNITRGDKEFGEKGRQLRTLPPFTFLLHYVMHLYIVVPYHPSGGGYVP